MVWTKDLRYALTGVAPGLQPTALTNPVQPKDRTIGSSWRPVEPRSQFSEIEKEGDMAKEKRLGRFQYEARPEHGGRGFLLVCDAANTHPLVECNTKFPKSQWWHLKTTGEDDQDLRLLMEKAHTAEWVITKDGTVQCPSHARRLRKTHAEKEKDMTRNRNKPVAPAP